MRYTRDVSPRTRTVMFNVRMTDGEIAMLRALAESDGLSGSDVVRQLIRREHRTRFGTAAPQSTKATESK